MANSAEREDISRAEKEQESGQKQGVKKSTGLRADESDRKEGRGGGREVRRGGRARDRERDAAEQLTPRDVFERVMTESEQCRTFAKREGEEEATSHYYERNDVSRRHTVWRRKAWWIRIDDGPNLRTTKERRRAWRAATRAADEWFPRADCSSPEPCERRDVVLQQKRLAERQTPLDRRGQRRSRNASAKRHQCRTAPSKTYLCRSNKCSNSSTQSARNHNIHRNHSNLSTCTNNSNARPRVKKASRTMSLKRRRLRQPTECWQVISPNVEAACHRSLTTARRTEPRKLLVIHDDIKFVECAVW